MWLTLIIILIILGTIFNGYYIVVNFNRFARSEIAANIILNIVIIIGVIYHLF